MIGPVVYGLEVPGTPPQPDTDAMKLRGAGVMMQVVPLRVVIGQQETFRSLHKRVMAEILESLRHAPYSVTDSGEYRKNFALLNFIGTALPTLRGTPANCRWEFADYQDEFLVVQVHRITPDGSFGIEFDHDENLIELGQSAHAAAHFRQVLHTMLMDTDREIRGEDMIWLEPQKQRRAALESEVAFEFDS